MCDSQRFHLPAYALRVAHRGHSYGKRLQLALLPPAKNGVASTTTAETVLVACPRWLKRLRSSQAGVHHVSSTSEATWSTRKFQWSVGSVEGEPEAFWRYLRSLANLEFTHPATLMQLPEHEDASMASARLSIRHELHLKNKDTGETFACLVTFHLAPEPVQIAASLAHAPVARRTSTRNAVLTSELRSW